MEYSTSYKGMDSRRFPQYVLVAFDVLQHMTNGEFRTVTCCSEQNTAKRVEKILTLEFQPVWEQFDSLS